MLCRIVEAVVETLEPQREDTDRNPLGDKQRLEL